MVQLIQVAIELVLHILDEHELYIGTDRSIMLRLIIYLKADDGWMLGDTGNQLADDTLCVAQVDRTRNVHNLSGTIASRSILRNGQHFWVGLDEPGRHSIGRRPDNDINTSAVHSFQYAIDRAEVEYAILWLMCAPRTLGDSHQIDPRVFHQRNVLF
ncbi:hypothetical protein D1872_230800 [compost metagenome]